MTIYRLALAAVLATASSAAFAEMSHLAETTHLPADQIQFGPTGLKTEA